METTIGETASLLSALGAGDRFWFWLCPDQPAEGTRLLVSALRSDPGMSALTRAAKQQSPPLGARVSMGLAGLDEEGRATLGAPGLDVSALSALAEWVRHHIDDHPALGRLKDARLMAVRPDGVVSGVAEEPTLWTGIVAPAAPGTLAGESEILDSLPEGADAWIWLSAAGPRAVVVPVAQDPQGELFRARVRAQERLAGTGAALLGVLHTTRSSVALTTPAALDGGPELVGALLATGHFRRLAGGSLLRMDGERFVSRRSLPTISLELSREGRLLAGLAEGEALAFWFSLDGLGGAPLLVLTEDRDQLREAVQAAGVRGSTTRGQLGLSSKGWVELRAREDLPGMVAALARFVAQHRGTVPALERLIGARVTVRDRQGEVVARQRDDAAWQALR